MTKMDNEVMLDLANNYLRKAMIARDNKERLEGLKKSCAIINNLINQIEGNKSQK